MIIKFPINARGAAYHIFNPAAAAPKIASRPSINGVPPAMKVDKYSSIVGLVQKLYK
ncbi:uncharacterized protein METZ01_LOCUS435362 [marine metagenome]|uniref:Uncharacterized protein n=1 Tax=marine metagenome TaxID=408172 RepID=A0A382YJ31_9ZZZZ